MRLQWKRETFGFSYKDSLLEENLINNGRTRALSQNFKTLFNSDSRGFRVPETVKI